ncbi:hypothetical protein EU546_02975 [Candidatus Thorarchaeota archaeon]|nr:MAG: hypothetical protein EU546_02975 [Candidatus Thorarchaeota archaeon]
MSIPETDGESPSQIDYRRAQQKECRNTTIYCVLSIALLITSGAINNPLVMDILPGGQLTMTLLTIGIVVSVLILCAWQFPRRAR